MILITFSYNVRYKVGSSTTSCWEPFHEKFSFNGGMFGKVLFSIKRFANTLLDATTLER